METQPEKTERKRKTAQQRFNDIHPELVAICELREKECVESKDYTGAGIAANLKIKVLKNGHNFNLIEFEGMWNDSEKEGA